MVVVPGLPTPSAEPERSAGPRTPPQLLPPSFTYTFEVIRISLANTGHMTLNHSRFISVKTFSSIFSEDTTIKVRILFQG